MTVVIRLTSREEAKALPILLRHSPGTVLPNRMYVLRQGAVEALRAAGVRLTELSRESSVPRTAGADLGVRGSAEPSRWTLPTKKGVKPRWGF
ncbi:MAG: hypothetical protein WD894_01600 [Pirellulales bacterium]